MLREMFIGFLRVWGRRQSIDERHHDMFTSDGAQAEPQLPHENIITVQEPTGEDRSDHESYENRGRSISADLVAHRELTNPTDSPESASSALTSRVQPGIQGVTVRRLEIDRDISNIYCVFCLAEDENLTDEDVILQCQRCQTMSHLGCMEDWLRRCRRKSHVSCCVCRSEEPHDALLRERQSRIQMTADPVGNGHTDAVVPSDILSQDASPSVHRAIPEQTLQARAPQPERPQALPRRSPRLIGERRTPTLRRSPRFRRNQMGDFEWEGV